MVVIPGQRSKLCVATRRALILVATLLVSACASDPEANSGPDAFLSGAEAIKVGQLATGVLDRGDGDTTDWKAVDLAAGGTYEVEFATDQAGASVAIGVYDRYGVLLAAEVREAGTAPETPVTLRFDARNAGRYFLRLEHQRGPQNNYGVQVEQKGSGSSGPILD